MLNILLVLLFTYGDYRSWRISGVYDSIKKQDAFFTIVCPFFGTSCVQVLAVKCCCDVNGVDTELTIDGHCKFFLNYRVGIISFKCWGNIIASGGGWTTIVWIYFDDPLFGRATLRHWAVAITTLVKS